MLDSFRSYQLSLQLYHSSKGVKLGYNLKDQLERAASSVCLNLSEGSAKSTPKERRRFYSMAFASCREIQTLIEMEPEALRGLHAIADRLGAHLYGLCR